MRKVRTLDKQYKLHVKAEINVEFKFPCKLHLGYLKLLQMHDTQKEK